MNLRRALQTLRTLLTPGRKQVEEPASPSRRVGPRRRSQLMRQAAERIALAIETSRERAFREQRRTAKEANPKHARPVSRAALFYNPKAFRGQTIRDARGVLFEVDRNGTLRRTGPRACHLATT